MMPTALREIDLNLLVVLDALLADPNVTRVARRLDMSQPATSHALGRLRSLLGDPLLVRSGGGMVRTPRGEALAPLVREAMDAVQRAVAPPEKFDPRAAKRTFRLATIDFTEMLFLPALAGRLHEEAPGVDVRTRFLGERLPRAALDSGEVDLALFLGGLPEIPEHLFRQPLLDERFVCCLRRGHPASRGPFTLERYASLTHLLVSPNGNPTGLADGILAEHGLRRRVAMTVPHFLVALEIVAESDLIVTMNERLARPLAPRLGLTLRDPPFEVPGGGVTQVWHERTHHDAGHRWLRSIVASIAASLPGPLARCRPAK